MALTQVSSKGIKDATLLNEDVNASANIAGSKLADNSISLAKLVHGDSNNNGKFLRANNGADPSFESIPAGITINNQSDNRVITATGTTDTLNAESNVIIDSNGHLGVGGAPDFEFQVTDASGAAVIRAKDGANNKVIDLIANSTGGLLRTIGAYPLVLNTNQTERMRIDSSGRVLIGTTTEGNANGDELTISKDSGNMGMTLRSGDSSNSHIYFSDDTSGAGEYAGYIAYQHSDNSMHIGTNSSERIHIKSNGNVGIGTSSPTDKLHVNGTTLLGGNTYLTSNTYISSNKGIYFSGGSSSANYLNDYEEGTYTPTFNGNQGGTITITSAYSKLRYVKVGNLCYIGGIISFTSNLSGSNNSLRMSTPFSAAPVTTSYHDGWETSEVITQNVNINNNESLALQIYQNNNLHYFKVVRNANTFLNFTPAYMGSGTRYIYINTCFRTQ